MHANCQGDELGVLLRGSAAFTQKYRLVSRTNYTREPVPLEELGGCDAFLYQYLGPSWEELASDRLLQQLSPSATALQIPNMFFKGYWPFWTAHSPIDFGDSLLNRLIDEGAPKSAIIRIYLEGDIQNFINLKESLDETIAIEREKEKNSCVNILDYSLCYWKQRMIYHTVNHPGRRLLVRAAQGILDALGLPALSEPELSAIYHSGDFPSYADFDLPVHPQVAAFYGLEFGKPDDTFTIFSRRMTFREYISRYIDCRLNKMDKEFIGYLQIV